MRKVWTVLIAGLLMSLAYFAQSEMTRGQENAASLPEPADPAVRDREREALIAFYDALGGPDCSRGVPHLLLDDCNAKEGTEAVPKQAEKHHHCGLSTRLGTNGIEKGAAIRGSCKKQVETGKRHLARGTCSETDRD